MEKLLRFLKFSLSTLAGTAVDCLLLWLLAELAFPGNALVATYIAPTISFECAVITNYTVAYFFVWQDRVGSRSCRGFLQRLLPYNVSCIAAFLIKMVPYVIIQHFTGMNVVLCNLIALVLSGIFNFVMNEWFIFRKKPAE